MNTLLLLFFAFPIAVIILSIVLEKIIRCPFLTAATFFAIFLVIAFAVFDTAFLVYVIAYTILSFLVAYITERIIGECQRRNCQARRQGYCENINRRECDICRCMSTANTTNSNNQIVVEDNTNTGNCCRPVDTARVQIADANGRRNSTWCCYRKN